MDRDNPEDKSTTVRLSCRRAFLRARDWVDGHQRLVSASLYATAAVSLWVLKRSIQDHRVGETAAVARRWRTGATFSHVECMSTWISGLVSV